jgi:hypothetical protein
MTGRVVKSSRIALAIASLAIVAGAGAQAAGPHDPTKLAAAQAIFARHVPAQAEMLKCLSVAEPKFFPAVKQDWDDELAKVGGLLAQANFPPDQASEMIGWAESKALMADAGDPATLRARCGRDDAWWQRWQNAQYLLFRSELEKLLAVAK